MDLELIFLYLAWAGLALAATRGTGNFLNWSCLSLALPGLLLITPFAPADLSCFEGSILVLVAFLGWLVGSYARSYLRAEACQPAFWRWFSVTLLGVSAFITTSQWLDLGLSWMLTSLGVHRLLQLHPGRRDAIVAAHKKFLVSRSADLCFAAAALTWFAAGGGSSLQAMADWIQQHPEQLVQVQWAACLLSLAVILKSALYPFHGWLVQVAEAPTPVSALLHAGVLNLGALLLYKASPMLACTPQAQLLLAGWGALSLFYGSLASLRQSDIKGTLAYSTVAQMGFVLIECAAGAFHLALLHMLAHSLYKAKGFLRSGSVVDQFVRERLWLQPCTPRLAVWLLASLLLAPWLSWAAPACGWIWARSRSWRLGPALVLIHYGWTRGLHTQALASWSPDSTLWALLALSSSLQLLAHAALTYPAGRALRPRLNALFLRLDSLDERLTRLALWVWPVDLPARARFTRTPSSLSEVVPL